MKNEIALSDAELILMEILWRKGPTKAREIAVLANRETKWEKNTVYTMLNRLINKGAVERNEPEFTCTAVAQKSEIQKQQTQNLLDRLYSGSAKLFLKAFIHEQNLSRQDLEELKRIIEEEK